MKSRVIDRLGRRRGPVLFGLAMAVELVAMAALVGLGGCFVDVDLGGSRLSCSDGRCPDGFDCVDDRCVPEGSGGQPGGDGDDGDGAGDDGDGIDADAAPEPEPDAGEPPPDAAPPDAPPPDAPEEPSACDEQYGDSPGYQLCAETRESCEFFVNAEVMASCDQHCADSGGVCLGARNDLDGTCTEGGQPLECGTADNNTLICTCTLGGL
jgi:hypothetical protein